MRQRPFQPPSLDRLRPLDQLLRLRAGLMLAALVGAVFGLAFLWIALGQAQEPEVRLVRGGYGCRTRSGEGIGIR